MKSSTDFNPETVGTPTAYCNAADALSSLICSMRKAMTMTTTLDTLELTQAELESSRDAVQRMAYVNWLNAGCPDGGQLDFWLLAEREWIEHCFVPSRPCDGKRPRVTSVPAAGCDVEKPSTNKSRRRERATAE